MELKQLKLKKIDLSKLSLEEDNHNHPDITVDGPYYLAKFGDKYYAGIFFKEWYGIVFNGKYPCGCQMNYPEWATAELWEIVEE